LGILSETKTKNLAFTSIISLGALKGGSLAIMLYLIQNISS